MLRIIIKINAVVTSYLFNDWPNLVFLYLERDLQLSLEGALYCLTGLTVGIKTSWVRKYHVVFHAYTV